jgi:alpha-1,3-mannosyltransferase
MAAPKVRVALIDKLGQSAYDVPYLVLLFIAEMILTVLIVLRVPYTEIDWVAYMQEVTTYQAGERDYVNIEGNTGPLVYPAGFLYLYEWCKLVAANGMGGSDESELAGSTSPEAIRKAQWLFVALYLFNACIVLVLYHEVLLGMRRRHEQSQQSSSAITRDVWYFRVAMGLTCLSKRVHSIFVLRLFNDAPAMTLLHLSMYLFACCDAWSLGCVVFSLAVSIKMNVLLFAPGLLMLLLQKNQSISGTMKHLAICALVQLVIGWPFLSTHPVSYIKKAFEFDRVFFFKWTVNWKFLSEDLFISKIWALVLLVCHLGTLYFLGLRWWNASYCQRGRTKTREWMCWTNKGDVNLQLSGEYIIYTLFVSNYIGVVFARTLHYQFYCWYFYSLPMMHLVAAKGLTASSVVRTFNFILSIVAILGIEYAFNIYPATGASSMVLQLSHLFLLIKIFLAGVPSITTENNNIKKSI